MFKKPQPQADHTWDEVKAVRLLQKLHSGEFSKRAEILCWLADIHSKLERGGKTSVMEHTALLYVLRSGFANTQDSAPVEQAARALELSWRSHTAKTYSYLRVIKSPLPTKAIRKASDRERIFHKAVFRPSGGEKTSILNRVVLIATWGLAIVITRRYGGVLGQVFSGALIGYTVASIVEYVTHRWLLHPSKKLYIALKRRFGSRAIHAAVSHLVTHHGIFPRQDYNSATNVEWRRGISRGQNEGKNYALLPDRDRVAAKSGLKPVFLHESRYGMSMNSKEIIEAAVIGALLSAAISISLDYELAGIASAVALGPASAITTPIMHPWLHEPLEDGKEKAWNEKHYLKAFILSSYYWRLVLQRHIQHHFFPERDGYSLFLIGPDDLLGTARNPDLNTLLCNEKLTGFLGRL